MSHLIHILYVLYIIIDIKIFVDAVAVKRKFVAPFNGNNNCDAAIDNIIIRCVDDGPSHERANNFSIRNHHRVIHGRRCRLVTSSYNKGK